jgi:hypothetical protein
MVVVASGETQGQYLLFQINGLEIISQRMLAYVTCAAPQHCAADVSAS